MGRLRNADRLTAALLQWGSSELRDLPWRQTYDPWRVLVSEVMLQQTSVQRVIDKYLAFIEAFPTPRALADAPLGEALSLWQGLGYPRRCRNLRDAAAVIEIDHDGQVPLDLDLLLQLPGVGPYTARAVLTFAYKKDVGVVDVNVARVLSRIHGAPMSARELQDTADELVPQGMSWEWNQVLMDLGARVCTARSPKCDVCPVHKWCMFAEQQKRIAKSKDTPHGHVVIDPARLSPGISRPQPRFEGSDRQVRGRVLRIVLEGEHEFEDLLLRLDMNNDRDRVTRLVNLLTAEGLIVQNGNTLRAP